MNVRVDYLYRDAANNKRWGESVFANPSGIPIEIVWERLSNASRHLQVLPDVIHFRPELVEVETLYFTDAGYEESEDDLDVHELHRIADTGEPATDPRTVEDFVDDVRRTHGGQ